MKKYEPEGKLFETADNLRYISSADGLLTAARNGITLEGRVKICDKDRNMIVELPCGKGIIYQKEGAIGIEDGSTKPIALITKVNKPVCFKVKSVETNENGEVSAILSRREAQTECLCEYINKLIPGDVIPARVTHMDTFGAFVDIGCGIPSLIPIAAISVSRISHPSDRFFVGEDIFVIIEEFKEDGKINLSHKELLGTWEQNAQNFQADETVSGIVRSIENYGVFIELAPNLAGLADHNPLIDVKIGQRATVHIKAIIPEKMKIKLNIVGIADNDRGAEPPEYFITGGNVSYWRYSSEDCGKVIESYFR
jgi:small subunit ribosomal protein S1